MATTTATPETSAPIEETTKKAPLMLTPQAIAKVREIMATQDPLPAGGCASAWWAGAARGSSTRWLLRTRAE